MEQHKIHTAKYYTRFIRVYFLAFVFVLVLILSFLTSSIFIRVKHQEKLNQVKKVRNTLNYLDKSVKSQLYDGRLNLKNVFVEFSQLNKESIKYIDLNDAKLLDSISKLDKLAKYFNVDPEVILCLEIINDLEKIDQLLLNSEESSFYKKDRREFSTDGIEFNKKWDNLVFLLNKTYIKTQQACDAKMEHIKRIIFILSVLCILVLIVFIIVLIYVFYYKIIIGLQHLKAVSFQFFEQKSTIDIKKIKLTGELEAIQTNLFNVFQQFKQTEEVLGLFYSKDKVTDYDLSGFEKNIFFDSVNKLKNQLRDLESNENYRNWNLNGITLLTEVVNKHNNDPKKLFEQFLITTVKYINAVQGGIFVKETEDLMTLEASYAYDRLKKKNRVLSKGETILGEVWEEEKVQYIENIPSDHFFVKSALGESRPVSMIIVPLIERGECFGVIELSVFSTMSTQTQDFVIKACEILSAATSTVKSTQKTKQLLRDTQFLAMKLKEEESKNVQKIQELKSQIEKEHHKLFLKDVELKTKKMLYDQLLKKEGKLINQIELNEINFKERLEKSLTNNESIIKLENLNNTLKKEIEELKETVHIRNVKIERMKRKLNSEN